MSVLAKMQIGPRGDAKVVLELDIEGAQFVADVMADEDNRTASTRGRYGLKGGDAGAREIAEEVERVIDQIKQRQRTDEDD